jgi:hypothetical protein
MEIPSTLSYRDSLSVRFFRLEPQPWKESVLWMGADRQWTPAETAPGSGYNIFDSAVDGNHAAQRLLPQEEATFHAVLMP